MATAHCPKCSGVIEGSLAEITRHIKVCGRAKKRGGAQLVVPMATATVVPVLPWEIRVPLVIKSQNQSMYSHWSTYTRGRDAWQAPLGILLRPVAGLRLPWSEWRITRVWGPRNRELDYGNLVGGAKPIPDALITAGVIVDDCPANFSCDYLQRKELQESYTEITLLRTAHERPADSIH